MKDRFSIYTDISVKCKCGHKSVMPVWVDKRICWWCGYTLYRNAQCEFKDKLRKEIRKNEKQSCN